MTQLKETQRPNIGLFDKASFVTVHTLQIDGGMVSR
jgi:hypothetical protein